MEKAKVDSRAYFGNQLPVAGEYILDPVHSFAEFAAQHLTVGQVLGRFDSITGKVTIAKDPLLSNSEFIIDTASINTHHPDRDANLRSERFFDVQRYPQMTFSSTEIKLEPGEQFSIEGDFTLRGITRQVSAKVDFLGVVDDPWGNTRIAFQGRTRINRKDFGLLADLEKETGGFPIGKDVRIKVATEAILKR